MDTRTMILVAARELFLQRGYSNTTIDEIMSTAGLGKGTMYLYFKSKEDLFLSLILGEWSELQKKIDVVINNDSPPHQRLRMGFSEYVRFFEGRPYLLSLIMDAEASLRHHILEDYFSRYYARLPVVIDIVSQAQREGAIRADIEPVEVINMFLAFANGLIHLWISQGMSFSLFEWAMRGWDTLWRGLSC